MTDLQTAALKQALEALKKGCNIKPVEWHQAIYDLCVALAQQADPTDPGHDVDVLREHVRHLERRVRELHAQQAEPVQEPVAKCIDDICSEHLGRVEAFEHAETNTSPELLEELKSLAIKAVNQSDYSLAKALFEVLNQQNK